LSVHHALDVAGQMSAEHGVELEVIDLRSLVLLDREAVLTSVAKTGHLLVVDEDYQSFGLSGEIAAVVAETGPRHAPGPGAPGRGARRPDPLRALAGERRAAHARADQGGCAGTGRGLTVTDVRFPQLSEEQPDAEGVLATWFVSDGDQVATGQLPGRSDGREGLR
jgi:hypothetical protein